MPNYSAHYRLVSHVFYHVGSMAVAMAMATAMTTATATATARARARARAMAMAMACSGPDREGYVNMTRMDTANMYRCIPFTPSD